MVDHIHHRIFTIAHAPAGIFVTAQRVCTILEVGRTHVYLDDLVFFFIVVGFRSFSVVSVNRQRNQSQLFAGFPRMKGA